MVKRPSNNTNMLLVWLKEDGDADTFSLETKPQVAGEWSEVVMDLSSKIGEDFVGLRVNPSVFDDLELGVHLFDNFRLTNDPSHDIVITGGVFATFEDEDGNPFILPDGVTIDDNPDALGDNDTEFCLKYNSGASPAANNKIVLANKENVYIKAASADHIYLQFFAMHSLAAPVSSEITLKTPEGNVIYQGTFNIPAQSAWKAISLDLSADDENLGIAGSMIGSIEIIPEVSATPAANATFYFDEFALMTDPLTNRLNNILVNDLHVFVDNNNIHVYGNDVVAVKLFGLSGVLLQTKAAEGAGVIFSLLQKGVYILEVEKIDGRKTTRKVLL